MPSSPPFQHPLTHTTTRHHHHSHHHHQWDAPDVDPIVFLSEPQDPAVPPAEVGQMRRVYVYNNSLFDLEAYPVA